MSLSILLLRRTEQLIQGSFPFRIDSSQGIQDSVKLSSNQDCFREEAIMTSNPIITATAFTDDGTVRTRKGRPFARSAECQPSLYGKITSYPWEGLYLEPEEAASAADNTPQVSTELDKFLSSLMYGE